MGNPFESYRSLDYPLPATTLGWNLYGVGLESMGKNGKPEAFPMPTPGDDQLLVRIDSVGVCFSDIKVLKQGSAHAKLYNRDLTVEPTRLGHEVSATIIEVGRNLQATYQRGQRVAVQPDTYQQGKSTAYGYTVPGGLMQYHLIGPEVLVTDAGACLLPLDDCMGYAESSLLEPWGCVMGAYTQRRRLAPRTGGSLWIVGRPGDKGVCDPNSWKKWYEAGCDFFAYAHGIPPDFRPHSPLIRRAAGQVRHRDAGRAREGNRAD